MAADGAGEPDTLAAARARRAVRHPTVPGVAPHLAAAGPPSGGRAAAAVAALRAARAELEEGATWQAKRAFPSCGAQVLLALLVVVNANDQVLKELSLSQRRFPYQVSSVLLVASLLSVLLGAATACVSQGLLRGLRRCFDPRQLRLCCLPSVLFACSGMLRFSALRFVRADVLAVMEPVFGLALSALAAWLLKRRAFGRRQVGALLFAMLGFFWFLSLGGGSRCSAAPSLGTAALGPPVAAGFAADCVCCGDRTPSMLALGWLCVLGSAVLGTSAGFAAERFLKQGRTAASAVAPDCASLAVQKTQLEVPAFFAALFWCMFLEPPWAACVEELPPFEERRPFPLALFEGWNRMTVAVLVLVLARSWLAAGVVKHMDTFRYSLAQVLAMLLTFLELELFVVSGPGAALLLPRARSGLGAYAAMGLVAVSMGAFSLSGPGSPGRANRAPGGGSLAGDLSAPLLGARRLRASLPWGSRRWRRWRRALAAVAACLRERCLRRRRGRDVALVVGYVAADTGKMLLVSWANHGRRAADAFLPSSLMLVQLVASVFIALGIAGANMGPEGLWLGVRPCNVLRCVPVATFFFVSKTCTVAALEHVDAGTVKLSTQLILPCSALLSVCLIAGRSYSREQWISITTVCLGTLAFHAVQIEADKTSALPVAQLEHRRRARAAGMLLCGAVISANSVGSVVGERLLKSEKGTPLACLKARLVLAELVIVILVLAGLEAPKKGGRWFNGWDRRVLICALGWVPATWMSTLITARFSTVVKNLVQCLSTLVTYFLALLDPSHDGHSLPATLLAFVVLLSVSTFTLQSAPDAPVGGRRSRAPSSDSDAQAADVAAEPVERGTRRWQRGSGGLVQAESTIDLVSEFEWKRCESDPLPPLEEWEAFLESEGAFLRRATL